MIGPIKTQITNNSDSLFRVRLSEKTYSIAAGESIRLEGNALQNTCLGVEVLLVAAHKGTVSVDYIVDRDFVGCIEEKGFTVLPLRSEKLITRDALVPKEHAEETKEEDTKETKEEETKEVEDTKETEEEETKEVAPEVIPEEAKEVIPEETKEVIPEEAKEADSEALKRSEAAKKAAATRKANAAPKVTKL